MSEMANGLRRPPTPFREPQEQELDVVATAEDTSSDVDHNSIAVNLIDSPGAIAALSRKDDDSFTNCSGFFDGPYSAHVSMRHTRWICSILNHDQKIYSQTCEQTNTRICCTLVISKVFIVRKIIGLSI